MAWRECFQDVGSCTEGFGIIGRKGEYIKRTCEETKAGIKILDGPGSTERICIFFCYVPNSGKLWSILSYKLGIGVVVACGQEQCNMHKENKNSKEDKMETREVGKKWKMLAPEAKQKYAKLAKQSLKEYKERKKDDPPKAPKITFVTRTQLKAAYSVIEGLQPLQVQSVKDIGFGGLLRLQCTKLDRRLCEWLVERFDPVSLCLSVFGKKLMITPLDVNHILGLPCGGERVTLKGPLTEIHNFCVKHEVRVQGSFCLNKLKETLEGMKNNYDDNDFKVLFVLYMMGTVLCPTSEFGVNKRFLHALKDTSTISKLDWSQFVLEFLANGIKSYKEKGRNAIRGCLLFLMVYPSTFYYVKVVIE
ncbi:hypothetical protein Vadar_031645 [Vaccinium darrowii]|uniref:Uncharacterized protein n=1 Tax=Vaccinium darrowii TaxID=229202 RepID=A0ACB7ZGQ5_9ERIC|nr:hypothetical protein Vadar_031645 [Vaccinium darrowii]